MISYALLDSVLAPKSLLLHAFYKRWSRGELTLEDLRVYAREYFHLVRAIPGIVSKVRDQATDPMMRSRIEENIIEEEEHIVLWERFASSLGISVAELARYEPSLMVREAVSHLEELASRSFEDGVAVVYALEHELPAIAQTKKEGLSKFYDLSSEDAHVYFDAHLAEEKHLNVWRSIPLDGVQAEKSAMNSAAMQNQILDSVCTLRGIPLMC